MKNLLALVVLIVVVSISYSPLYSQQQVSHAVQREHCEELVGGTVIEKGNWYGCELTPDGDGQVRIPPYDHHIRTFPLIVRTSNTTVNCNNNIFEVPNWDDEERTRGLVIRTDSGQEQVHDVTVKNCTFYGHSNSVTVAHTSDKQELFDLTMNVENGHDELRARTPTEITLNNITSIESKGVGIFIKGTYVTLKNSLIYKSGGSGIYLGFASQHNTIKYNIIKDNNREGSAIDSSAHNVIFKNEISGNRVGGIYLYRNCQERFLPVPPALAYCMFSGICYDEALEYYNERFDPLSPYRKQGADQNEIYRNIIKDEYIGLWVASRQSRNLGRWGCGMGGNPSDYYSNIYPDYWDIFWTDFEYIYRDYAKHNRFELNHFVNVAKGIIVEDDENEIINNTFYTVDLPIRVGTRFRSVVLSEPVSGTTIDKNRYLDSPKLVDLVWGSTIKNTDIHQWTANELYSIVAQNNKCLEVKDRSFNEEALIHQWECNGEGMQLFQFVPKSGHFQIKSLYSRLCLDIRDSSTENGALLQQKVCSVDDRNQLFDIVYVSDDSVQIVSVLSGKCLNVKNRSTENGALIQQWTCNPNALNTIFELEEYEYPKPEYICGDKMELCYKENRLKDQ